MESKKDDGGSAFPIPEHEVTQLCLSDGDLIPGKIKITEQTGMSLLDWFAGNALQAILQTPEKHGLFSEGERGLSCKSWQRVAYLSYQFSHAMIAERNKK